MWRLGVKTYSDPPTYFKGVKTPTPRIYTRHRILPLVKKKIEMGCAVSMSVGFYKNIENI